MSLNLPGYYYDPARNRYFPITSLPPGAPIPLANAVASSSSSATTSTAESSSGHTKKKRKTVANVSQPEDSRSTVPRNNPSLRGMMHLARSNPGISFAERSHVVHRMEAHAIARTRLQSQEELPLGPGCRLTALAVDEENPDGYQVAGDDRGWLFVRQPLPAAIAQREDNISPNESALYDDTGVYISPMRWFCDMGLMTKITAVSLIRDRFFVSSFGPHAKILVGSLDATEETDVSAFILEPAKAYDMWTAVFETDGRTGSAILGLHGKAMHIQDLDNRMSTRNLNTGSDVMAVCKRQHIVYTGERSGTVRLFDLRSGSGSTGSPLLKMNAMVTNVEVYRDSEIIAAAANGDMQSFDMRFMKTEQGNKTRPLLVFEGHKNTYMHDLGFAVLPSSDFVVAAGIDRRIRAWSTRTGEQVTNAVHGETSGLLDSTPADGDILAICASGGNYLRHTCERSVRSFELGKQ
ncbi:hypothetical protein BDV93DRAFT_520500 [Ceratobasidium sp. AG-I]|nr:hypothetical protein BDV93DRAFT_520500 [Ceratobasidium sp. AG-I]